MDSDSRPKASDRPRWGELIESHNTWARLHRDGHLASNYLWTALSPFLRFINWHHHMDIPWRHRWYIFLHGKLPEDF